MEIKKEYKGNELTLKIHGSINTLTAPDIEYALEEEYNKIGKLIVDLKDVDYISSAGLRVLTGAKYKMGSQGGTIEIININDVVNQVFEVTNFYELLEITRK